jgi:hypothetical protein
LQSFCNSIRSNENEDLTPNMRGGNSQSYTCYFRAGRTYGHYGGSRASAEPNIEREHGVNDHDYRFDDY